MGPAGTGKTFLAVTLAVTALKRGQVKRDYPDSSSGWKLVRVLVFFQVISKRKVDPYLRPVYDALYQILGKDQTTRLMEREIIEIAPLAYMRGRTLDDAFVILDEAQNTTIMQMKMFLTRLGFNSKMIVNGDISQIDLPRNVKSGLIDAQENSRTSIRLTLFIFQLRMWFAIQLSLRLSELMNQLQLKMKSVKKAKRDRIAKRAVQVRTAFFLSDNYIF